MAATGATAEQQQMSPNGGRGLSVDVLVDAGILAGITTAVGAIRRSRTLLRQAAFESARELLLPHLTNAPESLRPQVQELLALCNMRLGGDWRLSISAARATYEQADDLEALARVALAVAEQSLLLGDFALAERELNTASRLYQKLDDPAGVANVQRLRARGQASVGHVRNARAQIDAALAILLPLAQPYAEGLVRLERARILALAGDLAQARHELVCAERILAVCGTPVDWAQARLLAAELLLFEGDTDRATAAIQRLRGSAVQIGDLALRARIQHLLGLALAGGNSPSCLAAARNSLLRAQQQYHRLGAQFQENLCDIALADVEQRIGLAPTSRLQRLRDSVFATLPRFAAELELTVARIEADRDPSLAQALFGEARTIALQHGNRSQANAVDRAMHDRPLSTTHRSDDFTPPTPRLVPAVEASLAETQRIRFGSRLGSQKPPGETKKRAWVTSASPSTGLSRQKDAPERIKAS